MSSRIPKSFRSRVISILAEILEKTYAQMQPPRMAGSSGRIFKLPFRIRSPQEINAAGRKNSKLMNLACWGGVFNTTVSHRISKLPPPTPRPLKNPRAVPTNMERGKDSSINSGYLPTGSGYREFGGAIDRGFGCHSGSQETHRWHFLLNKVVICSTGLFPTPLPINLRY